MRNAIPFFAYWVLGSLYYRLDTILLSKLASAAVLGWYGAAYRLFDTLVFLPSIVASAILFPILAQLSTQSRPSLRRAMAKGLDIILIVGMPISVGLFTLAEPIIRFIYRKPEFVNAVPALQWLAVGLLLLYVNSILSVTLVSLNEERKTDVGGGACAGAQPRAQPGAHSTLPACWRGVHHGRDGGIYPDLSAGGDAARPAGALYPCGRG